MKKILKTLPAIGLLVLFDQLTKFLAIRFLQGTKGIPLIKNVLELYYVENRGAAFGIMQNKQWFFLAITLVILGAVVWLALRIPDGNRFRPLEICLVFITAGAVGNLIDRLFRHYVVDFIYFKLIDFPVFNVADIYVTVTAFAFVLLGLFYYKDEDFNRIFQ